MCHVSKEIIISVIYRYSKICQEYLLIAVIYFLGLSCYIIHLSIASQVATVDV